MPNRVWTGVRIGAIAVALMAFAGCAVVPSEPPAPPQIYANGVQGATVSYCIAGNYCADGALNPRADDNPVTTLPITLTFEEPISHITAEVAALDRDWVSVELIGADAQGRTSNDTIRITQLPPGEWNALYVSIGMAGEVSVGAAWELAGR